MTTTDEAAQRKVLNRLRRARGQLDAVITAVEENAPCRDVMTQLSAVTHALHRAGFVVVATAMEECLSDGGTAEKPGAMTTDELEKLFLALA